MAIRGFLGILLLALIWSPTFLVVRIGIETIPPLTLTFIRCSAAAIFLLSISLFRKVPLFSYFKKYGKLFLISSLLGNAIPFALCSLGELTVDSSTSGIIEGSVPIFTLFLGYFLFGQHAMNRRKTFSLFTGFVGLLIIFLPSLDLNSMGDPLGMCFLIGMSSSFAMGWLYIEKHLGEVPPLASSTIHLSISSLLILPFSLFFDQPFRSEIFSLKILFMGVALGVCGTALGWLLFFNLVRKVGAQYVSIATMLCPIFCVIWGKVFLDEPVTIFKISGIAVILSSVALMEEKLFSRKRSRVDIEY